MGFLKLTKSRAYYSRFQVKFRRRRQCRTNYARRSALLVQDKDKYNAPKYRLVARHTNTKIIAHVVTATMAGDMTLCSAQSTELPRYGIPVGLANYPASYCVGLLLARRLLSKLGLDKDFQGTDKADGEEYHPEDVGDRRPFRCILDIGLSRASTGARVFGVMKGAVDGGLNVPHQVTRFPGSKPATEDKEGGYDAGKHRERIFGQHVANYMKHLQAQDPDRYRAQFAEYIKAGISPDSIPKMYEEAHKKIRQSPAAVKAPSKNIVIQRKGAYIITPTGKYRRAQKLSVDERKRRVQEKLRKLAEGTVAV